MAFPASPTDKQTYTTALNTFYQYDSTRQAWLINSAGAGTISTRKCLQDA